jgi:hypothetical protein
MKNVASLRDTKNRKKNQIEMFAALSLPTKKFTQN